tara:strand:+ start:99 stop:476 length:378 start_codon:yes stop_codon:yes gene_type:complete
MTIMIVQILGILLSVMGLGILINPSIFTDIMDGLTKKSVSHFYPALLYTFFGSLLVTIHPMTDTTIALIITILGYYILIVGILWMILPSTIDKLIQLKKGLVSPMLAGALSLLIGLAFLYHVFMV